MIEAKGWVSFSNVIFKTRAQGSYGFLHSALTRRRRVTKVTRKAIMGCVRRIWRAAVEAQVQPQGSRLSIL